MADQGKKKKSKSKAKTVSLNEFLSSDGNTPPIPVRTKSWADETNDLEDEELSTTWTDTQKKPVDLNALPSAPRAATAPNIDMSRLPKTPPFTVFIGNLSYEASEDDIQNHFEKNNLNVVSVRQVKDQEGRPKGFGYAEFETLTQLVEALTLKGTMLKGRQLQVDVAEGRSGGGGMGDDRYMRTGRNYDDDRTTGNWRNSRDPSPPQPPRSYGGYRSGQDYGDRGSSYGRPRGFRDRRDDQYHSGGRDQYDGSRRNYSPPHDRSFGNDRSQSPRRQDTNDRQLSSPYKGRSPTRPVTPPNRGSPRDQGDSEPYDRPNQDRQRESQYNGNDRRPYNERRSDDRRSDDRRSDDRRYDDRPPRRDGGYGRGYDRGGYRNEQRDYGDRQMDRRYNRSPPPGRQSPEDVPKERKKLQLQPRSKTTEATSKETTSSIFGGAKPVDTTKKEREIEEKIKKKEVELRSRDFKGGWKDSESSESSTQKEPRRLPSDSDDFRGKERKDDNRERRGSNREEDHPRKWEDGDFKRSDHPRKWEDGDFKRGDHQRKWEDSDLKKGRGRRGDYNRSRDDERQPAGKGRGRGRKNVANDDKPPIILKKHEEQKPVEFEQKNRFAGLSNDEDGDDKCP